MYFQSLKALLEVVGWFSYLGCGIPVQLKHWSKELIIIQSNGPILPCLNSEEGGKVLWRSAGERIIPGITMWKLLSDFLTQRSFANSNRVNTRGLMLGPMQNWILIRIA